MIGGRPIHPVAAIPGGMSHPITEEQRQEIIAIARKNVSSASSRSAVHKHRAEEHRLRRPDHQRRLHAEDVLHGALVDSNNRLNFYDGKVRVVGPDGVEHCKYAPNDYREYVAERVEPWSRTSSSRI